MERKRKRPPVDPDWQTFIDWQEKQKYFEKLKKFVGNERKSHAVYPKPIDVFNAFRYTPYHKVKVVIIGRDPYHKSNIAHGLAFSSVQGETPKSLHNVFNEIKTNWYGITNNSWPFKHNNLTQWAAQGVLLLNSILTVREGEANSHADKGWEHFATNVIKYLNSNTQGTGQDGRPCTKKIIFMLWGKSAQTFESIIDESKHIVLTAAHPGSPEASTSFSGCDHFTKCNSVLTKHGQIGINWGIHETSWARRQYGY